jgi:hypothetical protein
MSSLGDTMEDKNGRHAKRNKNSVNIILSTIMY